MSLSILARTKLIFQKRPLLMNVFSFGTIYVVAEVSQQAILLRTDPRKESIDWATVARFSAIGCSVIAPMLFCWYKVLDRALPATTAISVVKKVIADQTISSPACISTFFVGMSILERKEDIFAEVKAKFWSTYKLSCCFWLPAQAINFALLPPYTRVAFVGCASFIWVNVLCLIKRQEIPLAKETEAPPENVKSK